MATYVFVNTPAKGHVNPTLPVVQELVARGEQVIYYLTEEYRGVVEATGAIFRPYHGEMQFGPPPGMHNPGHGRGPQLAQAAPGTLSPFILSRITDADRILSEVLDQIRADKPDVIIYEVMTFWGRLAANILKIPAIVFRPSYAFNDRFRSLMQLAQNFLPSQPSQSFSGPWQAGTQAKADNITNRNPFAGEGWQKMREALHHVTTKYDLAPIEPQSFFNHSEALNIVALPRAFQPEGESFDERFIFVGPCISKRSDSLDFPLAQLKEQRTLFISLGTVFNNWPEFFKLCLQAFGNSSWQVVLASGERINREELGIIPDNVLIAPYVPQLEILAHTDVFITHGGMNSTMESLAAAVPMVVIPQMIEQMATAQRVVELELGIMVRKEDVTAQKLVEIVDKVANEPGYRQNALGMQKKIQEAGGYQRAADAIIQFARNL